MRKGVAYATYSHGGDQSVDKDEHEETDSAAIYSSVWEMKKTVLASKQLYANMLHFAAQLVVNALKDGVVIDAANVYGLAIDYSQFQAKLYNLSIDFTKPANNTTLCEHGICALPVAINKVLSALLYHADDVGEIT